MKVLANIKSAIKQIRVIERRTARNRKIKSQLNTAERRFEEALALGDLEDARERLKFAEKKYMQAAAKKIVHKAKASRKISRLTQRLNKASS